MKSKNFGEIISNNVMYIHLLLKYGVCLYTPLCAMGSRFLEALNYTLFTVHWVH